MTKLLAAAMALVIAAPWPAPRAGGAPDAPREASPLCVDGWRLSSAAVTVLLQSARSHEPSTTLDAVATAVRHDRILGRYALHAVGDDSLFDDARVGYSLDTLSDEALYATLERARPGVVRTEDAAAVARAVIRRHALDTERLSALFATDSVRLDDRLAPHEFAALDEFPLYDFRLDGEEPRRLTLKDVWQRLDVQGRNQVQQTNVDFIDRQARRLLRDHVVRKWATAEGGLDRDDLARLHDLMVDRERRKAYALYIGASTDSHRTNARIEALKQEVTSEEIAEFYARHQDQFQRIERVRARHIRCTDEACTRSVARELAAGEPFADVARRHSTAATANSGGELGWIEAVGAALEWLQQVALAQAPDTVSHAMREPDDTPGGAGWQFVRTEERVVGLHPIGSETVRFVAAEAIAQRRAAEQFSALRKRLIDEAEGRPDPGCGQPAQGTTEGRSIQ
ncbi:peptidylprolyl isomerase [Aquabacterium humicola]|uniref:peptidylprolyl isomerase n=1 Tax=Aquabacterium humicola TaxID=3237377 RepID=UPI0025427563|nr:peptidylprolyl isomerase [Rubrivivax pictus]